MGESARKQPFSDESQVTETTLTRSSDESDKTSIVTGDTFQKVMEKAKETPPVFVLLAGPSRQMGKQWELLKSGMIIGRIMEADIFIDDRSVSRKHARILVDGAQVYVEDLGSANGTEVGDQAIPAQVPQPLRDNDRVKVGNVIIKFLAQGNVEALSNKQLYDQNQLDPLTQIHNKRSLVATGRDLFKRAKTTEIPLSTIVFDLDHFKKVNDTYGHQAGDFVLKEISGLIKDNLIRKDDFFARFGGEEFCLILFGSDDKRAFEVAERVRATVEGHSFEYQGSQIPVTVSMGVASLEPLSMESWEELFELADQATYSSKRGGRNRVTMA